MRRVVIFGNSASGKSTLAKRVSKQDELGHLDLDTIAWQKTKRQERETLEESRKQIDAFLRDNEGWVIEGCYSDLLEVVVPLSTEMVFMNLPVEACVANARSRPWEPHKYVSREAQDANLQMLLDWIAQYPQRDDTFSQSAHLAMYDRYRGRKRMLVQNSEL